MTIMTADRIIKLGPLECSASCLMTVMRCKGLDEERFLPAYWNLSYTFQTLMSCKHISKFQLEETLGYTCKYMRNQSVEGLIQTVLDGQWVVLPCIASELPFFPRNMLTHEEAGLDHNILIAGYDSVSNAFTVIDPIVEFMGKLPVGPWIYVNKDQPLAYYEIQDVKGFVPPDNKELFILATEQIYRANTDADADGGLQAFDIFIEEARLADSWDAEACNAWIYLNNISVGMTVKMRPRVWHSIKQLEVLQIVDEERLDSQVSEITKSWMQLNYHLVKFKRYDGERPAPNGVIDKLFQLKELEALFLEEIFTLGQNLKNGVIQ